MQRLACVHIDYSIGFTREEVEEILAAQKAELKCTLAAWSESSSSVQKRRLTRSTRSSPHAKRAGRLAPGINGRPVHVGTSEVIGHLPK